MSEKQKLIHKSFCNYEIAKAKSASTRILSVREQHQEQKGIVTANLSKAILAQQLAALF